jgi:hypothetical protein
LAGSLDPAALDAAACGLFPDELEKSRKRFFLKKEAKTLAPWPMRRLEYNRSEAKVFWFFFSKKNRS